MAADRLAARSTAAAALAAAASRDAVELVTFAKLLLLFVGALGGALLLLALLCEFALLDAVFEVDVDADVVVVGDVDVVVEWVGGRSVTSTSS